MRILLVVPFQDIEPYVLPNLGLGYLASALRKQGNQVHYLDCIKQGINISKWKEFLLNGSYQLIGIQMYSYTYDSVINMFKTAKEAIPDVINVAGGPHVNALPGEVLSDNSLIDYCIHGEGEKSFPELITVLEKGDLSKLADIPNLAWRYNSEIKINKKSYLNNLDDLDLPAWDLMDPRTYPALSHGLLNRSSPVACVFATRGCPYSCSYCSASINMGAKIRKRSPTRIVDEIEMLVKEYGVKEIHFEDDNFTFYKDFASQVCQEIIERKVNIFWACPNGVRLDSLDEDLLKLMERSGCYSFALGIESGSERVLKLMGKGSTTKVMREKIRLIAETTKIRMTGFFIFGFPGENEDDIKQTESLILNEPLHRIAAGPFMPLPGTRIFDELAQKGKIPSKYDWKLLSPYEKNVFTYGNISSEKLFRRMRLIHLKFYLRPKVLWGVISEINSWRQLLVAIKMFLFWTGIAKFKNNQVKD